MINFPDPHNDKAEAIKEFSRKPSAAKAQRLFAVHGVNLPNDIIEFLQRDMAKKASNYELNHKQPTYDSEKCKYPFIPRAKSPCETLTLCSDMIDQGKPEGQCRDWAAEALGVDSRTIYNRLKEHNCNMEIVRKMMEDHMK